MLELKGGRGRREGRDESGGGVSGASISSVVEGEWLFVVTVEQGIACAFQTLLFL